MITFITDLISEGNLRSLLYPLGFVAALAFGGRFLLQWIESERKKESVVTPAFWKLSLLGNVLLMIHSFIQVQFHVCVVQACNAVISWRNLNLMKEKNRQVTFQTVVLMLLLAIVGSFLIFMLQGIYLLKEDAWFRVPVSPWLNFTSTNQVDPFWHFLGFLGIVLFATRFWVQWWLAEKHKTSYLGLSFWWLSLAGDLLSLVYFIRIADMVNIIGPALGLIPYIRNLMIIRKSQQTITQQP